MNDVIKLGKKIFTVSIVVVTIIWSLGVAALVPAVANAAVCPTLSAGDMIKVTGKPAIYAVNNDLKVLYFPSGDEFKSWRPTYGGYISITQACFDSLSVPSTYPAAVNYHPGSYVVKRPSSDQLYVVEPGNSLAKITPAAALALYGNAYKVMTISDVFWPHYVNRGDDVVSTVAHPGMLVKVNNITYYIDAGNVMRQVTATGMTANGFQTKFVHTLAVTAVSGFTTGAIIDAEVLALTDKTQSGGVNNNTLPGTTVGALTVSLAADSPASQDIPENVSVEFLKLRLTASNESDVNVTGITLNAYGLGSASDIDNVTIYNNGLRYGNSRNVDSNQQANINFTTALVVKKGTSEIVTVKASVAGTGKYSLGIASSAGILASGSVGGTFPVMGNTMSGTNVTVGKLTIDDDGSVSNVKLGDKAATIAKFKMTNDNVEDITLNSIVLKRDSASTASDSAMENLILQLDGSTVASASAVSGHYVAFTLSSPVTILKNQVKRFTVKADVVDGAGKTFVTTIDSTSDVSATGNHYNYPSIIDISNVTNANNTITINAGAVSLEKVNAALTTVKKDQTDTILGTFKVTINSGATAELSTLKLKVASVNDAAGAQIENMEVFLKNTNTVYDLTSSTGNGVYSNTSMGLILTSGVTYEFVVRCDVKSSASNGDYTVSINDAAGGDMVLKETGNDTLITDITPNSVALQKVTVQGASVQFSKNALSAAYNAVVGTADVELLNFNVKAGSSSDVKITELKFKDRNSTTTKSVVSEFKLFKGTDLIKTVSANDLSAYEITFPDLNQVIAADQSATYKLTASLVKDVNQNGKVLNFGLSGYAVEDTDKGAAVYDAAIDPAVSDGVVLTGAFDSARFVTIKGFGSLNISVDNTAVATQYDSNQLAGSDKVAVATFKFKADNETVKVTQIKVVSTGDMSSLVSRYGLYDSNGNEVTYSSAGIGASTTTLDTDFTVSGEQSLVLKATLNKIGQDQPGALNVSSTYLLNSATAEGVDSGQTLTTGGLTGGCTAGEVCFESDVVGQSYPSKRAVVVASKISSVALVSSYGGTSLDSMIQSGISAKAAIIAVTVPATNNTNADGTSLKFGINTIKIKIEGNASVTTTQTIERIGGAQAATSSSATATNYRTFGGLGGVGNDDFNITPSASNPVTAYFLVRVTPTFTSSNPGDSSLKVSLDNLNGTIVTSTIVTAGAANFGWTDRSDANAKYPLYIPGVSYVDGTIISN